MAFSVEQLQHDVTDPTISVGTVIQKAILVANEHKDQQFLDWARRELNGYSTADDGAHHRNLKGQYVVLTSDGRTLPIVWDKDDPKLKTRFLTLPLAEMEALLAGGGDKFAIAINVDPRTLTTMELEPCDKVGFLLARATLLGFCHAVRQRVLDWTMVLTKSPHQSQQIQESAKATTPLERLTALKQELQDLTTDPWSNIEKWIAKATPIIRRDWPDHFDDFQNVAKTPQWRASPFAFGGKGSDEAEDRATFDTTNANDANYNRAIAKSAKDKLAMFLDGLIAISEPPNTANQIRMRVGNQSATIKRNTKSPQTSAEKSMRTAIIEVLDLKEMPGGIIGAMSRRYSANGGGGGKVFVRWDMGKKRPGWVSIGRVLFAEERNGWEITPVPTVPTALGEGRFVFEDDAHSEGMLLALIFPEGYTTESFGSMQPTPHGAKNFNGRLALLWKLANEQEKVTWVLKKESKINVTEIAQAINAQLATIPRDTKDIIVEIQKNGSSEDEAAQTGVEDSNEDQGEDTYDPIPGQTNANGPPPKPPASPPPTSPTEWLLDSARRIPTLKYAIGVVGLVAAAAISIGFVLGHWEYALFGGLAVFVGMILVRLYAASQPENVTFNPSKPILVVVWACVLVFVVVLLMGTVKLGFKLFANVGPDNGNRKQNEDDPYLQAKTILKHDPRGYGMQGDKQITHRKELQDQTERLLRLKLDPEILRNLEELRTLIPAAPKKEGEDGYMIETERIRKLRSEIKLAIDLKQPNLQNKTMTWD